MGFGKVHLKIFNNSEELEKLRIFLYEYENNLVDNLDYEINNCKNDLLNQIIVYKHDDDGVKITKYPKKTYIICEVIDIDQRTKILKLKQYDDDYLPKQLIIGDNEFSDLKYKLLSEHNISIGNVYISDKGYYWELSDIILVKVKNSVKTYESNKINPHSININDDELRICFKHESSLCYPNYDSKASLTLEEFQNLELYKLNDVNVDSYENKLRQYLETGDISSLTDNIILIGDQNIEDVETQTDLIVTNSSEHYKMMVNDFDEKRHNAILYQRSIRRHISIKQMEIEIMMKKELSKFDDIKRELNKSVTALSIKITKLRKLIATIEIFAGINEEIIQISNGNNAPDDVPISLRQMKLYMDEEIAILDNEGLGINNLEEFDEWVSLPDNYTKLIPNEKGIIIMDLRRNLKQLNHIREWMDRALLREIDDKTYVLIRNGENIYRLFTEHIRSPRLFPKKDELQSILEEMIRSQQTIIKNNEHEHYRNEAIQDFENSDNRLFSYKKNFVLLHGITTRTEIFNIPKNFNMMDVSTHKDVIEMVYDEEMILSDGRPTFFEWLRSINKNLKVGNRIYFESSLIDGSANDNSDRFTKYWNNKYSAPTMPNSGVYLIKPIKKESYEYETSYINEQERDVLIKNNRSFLLTNKSNDIDGETKYEVHVLDEKGNKKRNKIIKTIMSISYNEKDGIDKKDKYLWAAEDLGITREREYDTWTRFKIYNGDMFIVNFDGLLLEDLNYYINSRLHRKDYLQMLPILVGLKESLISEINKEKEFAENYKYQLMKITNLSSDKCEKAIYDAIDWWKTTLNIIIKRPFDPRINKNVKNVELQTLRILKKKYKLKDLDVSGNSVGNTLCVVINYYSRKTLHNPEINKDIIFFANGLNKKDFIEAIYDRAIKGSYENRKIDGVVIREHNISKSKLSRDIIITRDTELIEKAEKNKKQLLIKIKNKL